MSQFTALNDLERIARHAEIVESARALSSRASPFIDAVRRLASLRFVDGVDHDQDFMLFVALDSESDHIPPSTARSLCSPSWLEQCDRQADELERHYRVEVDAACKKLIARFSAAA